MPGYLKAYNITDVSPGKMLGTPVLSENGTVMLTEGTTLTQSMIDRLQRVGVTNVDILELPLALTKQPEHTAFEKDYHEIVDILYDSFQRVRYFKRVPVDELSDLAEHALDVLVKTPGALNRLSSIEKCKDRYTFSHSVNVGVTAGLIGKWLGMSGFSLKETILAGFLHDIGKTQLPQALLDKPSSLQPDEWTTLQSHTKVGYQLIESSSELSEAAKLAIVQHHERLDGSGYPAQIAKDKISHVSQIVAIADIFDAITSYRPYRPSASYFTAMEELSQEMFTGKIDPKICSAFLAHLQDSLNGATVLLNNGKHAKIVYVDRYAGNKPIVEVESGQYLNLREYPSLHITDILEM